MRTKVVWEVGPFVASTFGDDLQITIDGSKTLLLEPDETDMLRDIINAFRAYKNLE